MSLFGSLYTAVSGLNAQSTAFGNISDNVANSQTVGYKQVDTNFADYLTQSTVTSNTPGSVVATSSFENSVQGTVTATNNALNLAISGNGFFAVNTATAVSANGVPSLSSTQLYTRAGDFSADANGYAGAAINSSGQVVVSYSNGNSAVVAQVPLAKFNNADGLVRENAQNFAVTPESGQATVVAEGTGGAGSFVTSSVEASNVDISGQLTQLIVAQQAYSANTKIITTADQLLQQTVSMVT